MFSYVMWWIRPTPGLLPQRLRVPTFCVIGDRTLVSVMSL